MSWKVMPKGVENYVPRPGLEGPFSFLDRVLYYDPKVGSYWDPRTDFYVSQDEMNHLNQRMVDFLAR
jgi:hypothetical protein